MTQTLEQKSAPVWGVETCDSCGTRAKYLFYKEPLMLTFCGHHSDKFSSTLVDQEWEVTELEH